ncbi:MAG: hypothetical protein AB1483_12840 [Candidatus Zixiibacteriota bacterium]
MPRLIRFHWQNLILVVFVFFCGVDIAKAESGTAMLSEYFDLVMSGNFESAEQYWTPESKANANRFGIEYINIPLKIDCTSPAVRNPGLLHQFPPLAMSEGTALASDEYMRFNVEFTAGDGKLEHHYLTYSKDGYYWLMFPQDYFSSGWPEIQTKYLLIKYDPATETVVNTLALDEFDRYITRAADSLGLSQDDMKHLEKEKLRYFLCQNETQVKDITGYLVKGTYDLASDDIISSFFPHFHEVTHFLVNYKLRKLHLYTLPIMREGVAVYLAGRWGKAPASLLALGGNLYQMQMVELDSILTMQGFEQSAGSDLAYPLAGLFTAFLRTKISFADYLELYRYLSGEFDDLYKLSPDDIKTIFAEALSEPDWDTVRAGFDRFVAQWLAGNAGIYPGDIDGGKALFESPAINITEKDGWLSLTVKDTTGSPQGNILVGKNSALDGKVSSLFDEQYQAREKLDSHRYGIRFDRNEAGVYDYATNHLVAKYIWGITPSENYYSDTDNTLHLRFKKDLIGGADIAPDKIRVLPH